MYKSAAEAVALVQAIRERLKGVTGVEVAVFPPFTALSLVARTLQGSPIRWGAQDLFWEREGAYTGEIAPPMLVEVGCTYVIVGHSERRQYFGETDATAQRKIQAAVAARLVPILCVGESLTERDEGKTAAVVERQVRGALTGLRLSPAQLVIAYEPVWAIGTGRTATPAQANEVHALIRKIAGDLFGEGVAETLRILYGGSVKPESAHALMEEPEVDGALVGGASLDAASFARIVAAAAPTDRSAN